MLVERRSSEPKNGFNISCIEAFSQARASDKIIAEPPVLEIFFYVPPTRAVEETMM